MRRCLLVLFASASCDRVFGLDDLKLLDGLGGEHRVTAHYTQRWFDVDPNGGLSERNSEFAPDKLVSPIVTLDDGSTRNVTLTQDGLSFAVPQDQHYTLSVLTPVGSRSWSLTGDTLELVERYIHPPDRGRAPAGTVLRLNLDAATSGLGGPATEEIMTIGAWSRHPSNTTNPTVDVSALDSNGEQIGPLVDDGAFYTKSKLVGFSYSQLQYAATGKNVSTMDAQTTLQPSVAVPMVMLDPSQSCSQILPRVKEEQMRVRAALPNGANGLDSGWAINIDPALDFGILLSRLPVASNGADVTSPINVNYANPFGYGQADLFELINAVNGDGALEQSIVVTPVDTTTKCGITTRVPDAADLPINVTVNSTALTKKNQTVALPGESRVEIAWDVTGDGATPSGYLVLVDQLSGSSVVRVEYVLTTDKRITIPTADFVRTQSYRITVSAAIGFPNAASGDFKTVAAPIGLSSLVAPQFTPM